MLLLLVPIDSFGPFPTNGSSVEALPEFNEWHPTSNSLNCLLNKKITILITIPLWSMKVQIT